MASLTSFKNRTSPKLREQSTLSGDAFFNKNGMSPFFVIFIIFLTLIFFYFSIAEESDAGKRIATSIGVGGVVTCNLNSTSMSGAIIDCIRILMSQIGNDMINSVTLGIGKFISAICTIALVFMGYKIIFGVVKIQAELGLFIIKLLIVLSIASDPVFIAEWMDALINFTKVMGDSIVQAINPPSTIADCSGGIFYQYDCILLKMIGVNPDGSLANYIGLGVVMVGLFFSGPFGLLMFLLAISYIIVLVTSLVQALFMYIISIVAITFLMGILPIILPFMLFNATRQIFEKWVKHLFIYTILPIILTAFLAMTFLVLGEVADIASTYFKKIHSNGPRTTEFSLIEPTSIPPKSKQYTEALKNVKGAPPTPSVGWWSWENISGSVKAFYKKMISAVGTIWWNISIPYLDWTWEITKEFLALELVTLVLCIHMISFMKILPTQVERMVSNASAAITPLSNLGINSIGTAGAWGSQVVMQRETSLQRMKNFLGLP